MMGSKGLAKSCFLSLSLPPCLFFMQIDPSLGYSIRLGVVVCTVLCPRRLAVWLTHSPTSLLYFPAIVNWNVVCSHRLSTCGLMLSIWSCMDRQTKSTAQRAVRSSLCFCIILGLKKKNEQPRGGKKKYIKCVSVTLCGACLIQRITAQYVLLIPLPLCTTSISHHIYLVFKGLTQILQCSRDSLPKLLGFKSHPFFSTTQTLYLRHAKKHTNLHTLEPFIVKNSVYTPPS